ncbi:hypothetical protein V2G26_003338 [Clonostachys chloroleuca]
MLCASYSCSILYNECCVSKNESRSRTPEGGELACGMAEGIKQVQIPNCFVKDASTRSSVDRTAPSLSKKRKRKQSNNTAPIVPYSIDFSTGGVPVFLGICFPFVVNHAFVIERSALNEKHWHMVARGERATPRTTIVGI